MTRATSSTPTGVERHICTGGSGIVLKRLRDQRIGLMHLFDMSLTWASQKLESSINPLDDWRQFGMPPLPWFNLAITSSPVSPRRPSI
jgi:hypothetical protein